MNALLNAVNVAPVTTGVLLKDKIEPTSITEGASKSLANMEASRITWEKGAYRTSNQALYAVLADCLAFCGELTIAEAKQRSAALEAFYKERGYKYKKDLPLATRVVRAVFGEINRRRISTYSIVIRQAQKENIGVADLAKWIEDGNGVQEISLGKSATYIKPADKAEIAKNNLKDKAPIGYAKSELLSQSADAQFLGRIANLLKVEVKEIINFELNVFDTQKGVIWGANQEFIANSQLDNLSSCHAAITALLANQIPHTTSLCALFDHEEVGSESATGASGSFLSSKTLFVYGASFSLVYEAISKTSVD